MLANQSETKYRFKIYVVNQPISMPWRRPAAISLFFAAYWIAPKAAEELAGVFSHELQHILKRHVTRSLLE